MKRPTARTSGAACRSAEAIFKLTQFAHLITQCTDHTVTRDFTLTLFKRRTFYFIFHKIYRVRVVRMQVLLHSQGWGNVRGGKYPGGNVQGEMSDTRRSW